MLQRVPKQDDKHDSEVVVVTAQVPERDQKVYAILAAAFLVVAAATRDRWILVAAAAVVLNLCVHFYHSGGHLQSTLICLLVGAVLYNEMLKVDVLPVLRWMVVFNAAYSIVQFAGLDPLMTPLNTTAEGSVFGFVANPNVLSALVGMCLPLFFKGRWRWALPVCVACLVVSRSLTGVIAAGAGTIVYVWMKVGWRESCIAVLALVILAGVYTVVWDTNNISRGIENNPRLIVWKNAGAIIKESPFIGFGLGSWQRIYTIAYGSYPYKQIWAQAHNEWVQSLVELGIVGTAAVILLWAMFFVKAWGNDVLFPTLVACAVASAGLFTWHLASTGLAILAVASAIERRYARTVPGSTP